MYEDVQYYCCECKEACSVRWEDEGIGSYEYWGAKGIDVDWQAYSDCCDASVTDEDPGEDEQENEEADA